ncbi:RING-type E3 ubiquitin transferase [Heracleum sosnowskyi]|uniref:RING-type E3 ubiquitin transferase n=1 Tax=Heracleum sosnowskyi TaxID=360622 RepID=A0AAD8MBC9_9APIA|nr:RING-type E3 ubiquitin transferase [Heracleum sosnowskyi]
MSHSVTASSGELEESAALQLSGIMIIVVTILLFILVLLVIIFRLHTIRHHFWNHHPTTHSTSSDLPTLQQRQGLDPTILTSIKVIEFSSTEAQLGLECSVCLSQVSQGEKTRFLPKCNHGFHMQCIDIWFRSHSTCPLCRNVVAISPDDLEAAAVDAGVSPDSQPPNASSSTPSFSGVVNDAHLAIEITIIQTAEEDHKSPVTPRVALYRSLSRLLSRNS